MKLFQAFCLAGFISVISAGSTFTKSLWGNYIGGKVNIKCHFEREASDTDADMQNYKLRICMFKFSIINWDKFIETGEKQFFNDHDTYQCLNDEETAVFPDMADRLNINITQSLEFYNINFVLSDLQYKDDGFIGCSLFNGSEQERFTVSAYINITGPARFVNISDTPQGGLLTLNENSQTVTCDVGIPNMVPKVYIYLDSDKISSKFVPSYQYPPYYYGREDGLGSVSYTAYNFLTYKDHGKTLRCEAALRLEPTIISSVELDILFSPKEATCPYVIYVPLGQSEFNITCTVLSNPNIKSVVWSLNSTNLQDAQETRMSTGAKTTVTLTISDVKAQNIGNYKFEAANQAGDTSNAVTMVKIGKTYKEYATEEDFTNGSACLGNAKMFLLTIIFILYTQW